MEQKPLMLKKKKSEEKLWEDKIWLSFYELGYDVLNAGRKIKQRVHNSNTGRRRKKQIDVCVNEEHVYIIECKCSTSK